MFFIKDDPPPLKTHPSFSSIKLLLGPIGERERERDPASERTDSNASVRRRLHRLETCNLDLEFSINPRYMNADGDRDKTVQSDVDPDHVSTTEKIYKMRHPRPQIDQKHSSVLFKRNEEQQKTKYKV